MSAAAEPHVIAEIEGSRISSFGHGRTVLEEAQRWALGLIDQLEDGEINDEWGYAVQTKEATVVTIAGGGPAAEVMFVEDEAWLTYYEGANAAVLLPSWLAERLREAMNQPPKDHPYI